MSVGGDGTINEVVNGNCSSPAPDPGEKVPDVAIIPGGSNNVLARNLGIPENSIEATGLLLDALRSGRRQSIGLGRLDDRYFTFTAGFGLDADVIRAVEAERERGRVSTVQLYIRAAIRRPLLRPARSAARHHRADGRRCWGQLTHKEGGSRMPKERVSALRTTHRRIGGGPALGFQAPFPSKD